MLKRWDIWNQFWPFKWYIWSLFFFNYQMSKTRLNFQVALMMEEKRQENQTEELDSSRLEENSQETSQMGSAPPVSVKEQYFRFSLRCQSGNGGSFSSGHRTQKCADAVLLPVSEGPLCCAPPDGRQLWTPGQQRTSQTNPTKPGATAGRAERPEGPVWSDEESAQVWLCSNNHCSDFFAPILFFIAVVAFSQWGVLLH